MKLECTFVGFILVFGGLARAVAELKRPVCIDLITVFSFSSAFYGFGFRSRLINSNCQNQTRIATYQ